MKSTRTQSLFDAAREDGPDDVTRRAMFNNVVAASVVAAGASVSVPPVAAALTKGATLWGLKLLLIGTVIGAVGATLGLAFAFGGDGFEGSRTASEARRGTPTSVVGVGGGATLSFASARKRDPHDASEFEAPAPASAPVRGNTGVTGVTRFSKESGLAEEATLVTAARNALLRGDPAHALSLVRATAGFGTRALEPEEMGLEARALRALDRTDEALVVELALRKRYPEHALSR